jgi:hypothetical protein
MRPAVGASAPVRAALRDVEPDSGEEKLNGGDDESGDVHASTR